MIKSLAKSKIIDDNMNTIPQLNNKVNEASNLVNVTSPDYNKVGTTIDEAITLANRNIAQLEEGYNYADGPYKELINLALKKDRLYLNLLNCWKNKIEYLKQGNTAQALQLVQQEQNLATELTKADNEYTNYKSTHPDVKEHTIKYWNSANV